MDYGATWLHYLGAIGRSLHIEMIEKFSAQIKKYFHCKLIRSETKRSLLGNWNRFNLMRNQLCKSGQGEFPGRPICIPCHCGRKQLHREALLDTIFSLLYPVSNQLIFIPSIDMTVDGRTSCRQAIKRHVPQSSTFREREQRQRKFVDDMSVNKWVDKVSPPPTVNQLRTRWKIENHL